MLKIIDLTHRLPGPLAGKILCDLGAEVIKIEDDKHRDPFLSGMFSEFDNSFEDWYEEINKKKKIVRLNFKAPDIKEQLKKYLDDADGILLSLSPKLKESLGLDDHALALFKKPKAVVELEASKSHKKAMHDLNALALSGYLALHVASENRQIVDPPFFPLAGILFGQQVGTQLLANILEVREKKSFIKSVSYLFESTENVLHPFWSKKMQDLKRTKFLHNGAYPCYSLYKTKDAQYVALAAVEEKFWTDFTATFDISIPLEKRFEKGPAIFEKVAQKFAKLTSDEIENMAHNKELCLSIVRKIT